MFSPVYTDRVLDPAFSNWKDLYARDSVEVHRAHLLGLLEAGIVSRDKALALAGAMDQMDTDFQAPATIPPGVEDLYFLYEGELGRRLGQETAAWLHTARSRNDMDGTIFRLALRRALLVLGREVQDLLGVLLERSRATSAVLTVLYTHGQPANVSTLGHYLSAFAGEVAADLEDFLAGMVSVNLSTMGACAITGTGFPLRRDRVASLLGFPGYVANTYEAISSSHWLTRPCSALEALLQDYTRLAADLLHKASCEVGLITFPDSLVQVSSIMPQKRNPVILEHLRIQAGLGLGSCASLRNLWHSAPYQDVNEAADAPVSILIDSLGMASSATALLREIVLKLGGDEARAREIALGFGVTTTELADTLVRECGVGFRSAHEISSRFVRSGRDLGALRSAFLEITGAGLPFSDDQVEAILAPERFVEVRKLPGGPAPEGLAAVFESLEASRSRIGQGLDGIEARMAAGAAELARAWKALGR